MEGHIKTSSQIYCKSLLKIISVLNTKNMIYLNKKIYTFGLSNKQPCSFCEIEEEAISHLFYY